MQNSTKFKHNFILPQNQMGRFVRNIEWEILLEYKSKRQKKSVAQLVPQQLVPQLVHVASCGW